MEACNLGLARQERLNFEPPSILAADSIVVLVLVKASASVKLGYVFLSYGIEVPLYEINYTKKVHAL
jgi:hypothetical protein